MPTTLRNTDILFNDGTTQSTAATAQSTAFGAVGTYAILLMAANNALAIDGTVAGSSLRYNYSQSYASASSGNLTAYFVQANNSTYGGGGTSLSGTWRKLSTGAPYRTADAGCGITNYFWQLALYVRIS